MRVLVILAALVLARQASADNSCFADPAVRKLIAESEEIDVCFSRDAPECLVHKMTVEQQRELNSKRLVPYDRTTSRLMNNAVGLVEFDVRGGEGFAGSGQKISRCHVLTSAHLVYSDVAIPVGAESSPAPSGSEVFRLAFHTGQTCDSRRFRSISPAHVFFKMTREEEDFTCGRYDNAGRCRERNFFGRSDLLILRLSSYQKDDRSYFRLRASPFLAGKKGQRVTCWGYPGYNSQIKLPQAVSDRVLWFQKDARIFVGFSDRGMLTNAIAYPGMSGGGCSMASDNSELVGLLAERNSATGISAIDLSIESADTHGGNFLAPLSYLAARYRRETGKDIADLDKECD